MDPLIALEPLRAFYESGETRSYEFRIQQLKRLKAAVLREEEAINQAIYADLRKNKEEIWITETGFVLAEIDYCIRNLRKWMRPQRKATVLLNWPSSSFILSEPLGVVLIIGPWNYPLQLLLAPLVGAIAAGNCVLAKGSEFAPATSIVLKRIVQECFPENYIRYIDADGAAIIPPMIDHFHFDHIFFTGSPEVGTKIYQMAAAKLIPVTLELGGKSPLVIAADAALKKSAMRVVQTKFSNLGQMCVAPDYLLVHESVKTKFIALLCTTITEFYGENPADSYDYGRIVNEKQFDRLLSYLQDGEIVQGGRYDREDLYLEPTVLTNVSLEAPIMREEIFGPILPVIGYSNDEEALAIIKRNPNPLAFYIFTSSKTTEKKWLNAVAFGGGCVNTASLHFINHHIPVGGRGRSGIGRYHGRYSFDTFSHQKGIMRSPLWFNPSIKFPPYKGKIKLFKWL